MGAMLRFLKCHRSGSHVVIFEHIEGFAHDTCGHGPGRTATKLDPVAGPI